MLFTNLSTSKLVLLILAIGTLFFVIDVITASSIYNKCKNKNNTIAILFLHHLFASYLYFGWISNNATFLLLYVTSILIVFIIQFKDNFKCPSTLYVNNNCSLHIDDNLRDILHFTGIKKLKLYSFYFFCITCIALYKLFIKK